MKVNIVSDWGESLPDYDLRRDQPLEKQIAFICQQLKASGGKERYALFVEATFEYIRQDDLANVNWNLADGASVRLKLRPEIIAGNAVKKLTSGDADSKKKVLTLMKGRLKDKEFAVKFIEMDGLTVISNYVQELSKTKTLNLLGFALTTLECLMSFRMGWEKLGHGFLHDIVPFIYSPNLTASRRAIEIVTHLISSPSHGFSAVDAAVRLYAENEHQTPYEALVQLLGSRDLNVKMASLSLLCALIAATATISTELNRDFLSTLDNLGINKLLKEQVTTIQNKAFKDKLYEYQRARLWELRLMSDIPYDKANEEHEAMLGKLWELVFPDVQLESRVSRQWKAMGFQGTDPATDFRGMGLLGLKCLLYIAEFQTEKFRKIVKVQRERKDHDYPVAVAGINICKMLYELLYIADESPQRPIFNILFDHPHAFEEMFCIAFQVLDYTWDDMKASYMEFPKVLAAVRKQISDVLAQNPSSIDMFHRVASWKQTGLHEDEEVVEATDGQGDPLNKLRANVRKTMLKIIKEQKFAYLRDGSAFRVHQGTQPIKAAKGAKPVQQLNFFRMAENRKELNYGPIPDNDEKTVPDLTNTLKQSDCKGIVTGLACPVFSAMKKVKAEDEALAQLTFAIAQQSGEHIHLVALNQNDFVNWTDGLRAWLGLPFECTDTLEDLKVLVETEMEVKLLDLEGINIPSTPPAVPQPPANYDFYYKDNEEVPSKQPVVVAETRRRAGNISLGQSRVSTN